MLAATVLGSRQYTAATSYVRAGLDYCSNHGLERDRVYLLAFRARLELDQGPWAEATHSAMDVLRIPRTSITSRIFALVVLGLIRARRGDPGQWTPLDEAWALAGPTGELAPAGASRGGESRGGLAGRRPGRRRRGDAHLLQLAQARHWRRLSRELTVWRRRAGFGPEIPTESTEPYALAGKLSPAADRWRELGCPYESALALADAEEEEPLRRALEQLHRLGARPAADIVTSRLRDLGVRRLPRRPRRGTAANPSGDLRNADIAARLHITEKTVDHHVSAILAKLGVPSRREAARVAAELAVRS